MKHIMYIFDAAGRLSGMQDVTSWPVDRITTARIALATIGRTAEVSDKGRAICAVCLDDLGERELPAGQVSHGYCAACYQAEAAKIKNIYVDPKMPGMEGTNGNRTKS